MYWCTVTWRDKLWRRGRLDEGGLCQHGTSQFYMSSGTDTTNCVWTNSLWQEQQWFLYIRSQLLLSVWTGTRISTGINWCRLDLWIDCLWSSFWWISITYGNSPRKHILAFTSGLYLKGLSPSICPCNSNVNTQVPAFIGNDYYCETGNNIELSFSYDTLYANDPLWDGQQCVGTESLCCTHPQHAVVYQDTHSMRPPLRTLNWVCVEVHPLVMRILQLKWLNCLCTKSTKATSRYRNNNDYKCWTFVITLLSS